MGPMSVLATIVRRIGHNLAHNLDYIPEDRLDWKPAPTAKSALEIVNHTAYFLVGMGSVARTGAWEEPQVRPATNRDSARELIIACATQYADAIAALTRASLLQEVHLPSGTFPLARAVSMAAVDLIHHHGQIAYIQTLLGDTEDHFDTEIVS